MASDLAGRQSQVAERIQSASRELERIPPRAIQEARLRREVDVTENLDARSRQRYEGVRIEEALQYF